MDFNLILRPSMTRFEILLMLLFSLLLFTSVYTFYIINLIYGPVGKSEFYFPEGPYIECFVLYLDFPLNNHVAKTNVLLYSARGQQLRNRIPVRIQLNLIRGT